MNKMIQLYARAKESVLLRKSYRKMLAIAAFAFLLSLLLAVFTKNNGFPYFYHLTEPSKAEQATGGQYNFNHPMLMLTVAKPVIALLGSDSIQKNVEIGRWISAVFAACAVLLFSAIAYLIARIPGFIFAFVFLSFSPGSIELSHYFKEDPYLMFGIAFSLLSLCLYAANPSKLNFFISSAACAFAASGKYVGFVLLPFALMAILFVHAKEYRIKKISRLSHTAVFVCVFLAVFLLINYQMLNNANYLVDKLSSKLVLTSQGSTDGITTLTGHGGVISKKPIVSYVLYFFTQSHSIVPVFALLYLIFVLITFKKRVFAERIVVSFFIVFFILLNLGNSPSMKYFYPLEMISHLMAALCVVKILAVCKSVFGKKGYAVVFALALFFIPLALYSFADRAISQFAVHDTRKELLGWLEIHTHGKVKVASDTYIHLPMMVKTFSQLADRRDFSVVEFPFAGDLGSLDEAIRQGYTHVAACSSNYERYFSANNFPAQNSVDIYNRRRNFYTELFKNGKLVWESHYPNGSLINEHIRLYELTVGDTYTRR